MQTSCASSCKTYATKYVHKLEICSWHPILKFETLKLKTCLKHTLHVAAKCFPNEQTINRNWHWYNGVNVCKPPGKPSQYQHFGTPAAKRICRICEKPLSQVENPHKTSPKKHLKKTQPPWKMQSRLAVFRFLFLMRCALVYFMTLDASCLFPMQALPVRTGKRWRCHGPQACRIV